MHYNDTIAQTLHITPQRASLVEAFLRLEHGTLDSLSRADIRMAYVNWIQQDIDADVNAAMKLAETFGVLVK